MPVVVLALFAAACVAPSTSAAPQPAGCGSRPPEAGVYSPDRLQVLDPCRHVEGRVAAVAPEEDGDHHIWILPDPGYEGLLNGEDHFQARPALLAEVTPDCGDASPPDAAAARRCPRAHFASPAVGDHVAVDGPWVLDLQHGWREIHPVDAMHVARGSG